MDSSSWHTEKDKDPSIQHPVDKRTQVLISGAMGVGEESKVALPSGLGFWVYPFAGVLNGMLIPLILSADPPSPWLWLVLVVLDVGCVVLVQSIANRFRESVSLRGDHLVFNLRRFQRSYPLDRVVLIRGDRKREYYNDSIDDMLEIVFQDGSAERLPMRFGLGKALRELLKDRVNVVSQEMCP